MSRKSSEVAWKAVCCLSFVLALAVLMPRSVAAQEKCDDASRANFAAAVASGASDEELEARFGLCRDGAATKSLTALTAKSKVVSPTGGISSTTPPAVIRDRFGPLRSPSVSPRTGDGARPGPRPHTRHLLYSLNK